MVSNILVRISPLVENLVKKINDGSMVTNRQEKEKVKGTQTWKVGTWNVGGLNGKEQELIQEFEDVGVNRKNNCGRIREVTDIARDKEMEKGQTKTKVTNNGSKDTFLKEKSKVQKFKKYSIEDKIIKVGTWNVRTTYKEGALKNLVKIMKQYAIDILALQETKQKGREVIELNGYVFFNSGGQNRYFGVEFTVSKRLKTAIVNFEDYSDRICKLRFQGKYRKISIVNVHAPTEDKELKLKTEFYEEVERFFENIPKFDLKNFSRGLERKNRKRSNI